MGTRVKYPLTEKTKEVAVQLTNAWKTEEVGQSFIIVETNSMDGDSLILIPRNNSLSPVPQLNHFFELAHFDLLTLTYTGKGGLKVLLLQELRNAVENDFEVSDFFLTTNTVGTYISGDLTIQPGGLLQSAAASSGGTVNQNAYQVASDIESILGETFLTEHSDIAEAVQALQDAPSEKSYQQSSNLLNVLSRGLDTIKDSADLIQAIQTISLFLPIAANALMG